MALDRMALDAEKVVELPEIFGALEGDDPLPQGFRQLGNGPAIGRVEGLLGDGLLLIRPACQHRFHRH